MTAPSTYLRQLRDAQARRRLELARLLRDDPSANNKELAKALNVDRHTIAEDRLALMQQVNESAKTETQIMREDQLDRIQKKMAEIEDDQLLMSAADRHLALWRWMKLETTLRGTAAPTRSENLNVNVDGENVGPYRQFVLAVHGLDAEQVKQLLTLAREMPRKPFVMIHPPETSPLWGAPKQLEEDNATR
jgi:hypothetical protein